MEEESLVIRGIKSKKACPDCRQEMRLCWMTIVGDLCVNLATYPAFLEYHCASCEYKEAVPSKVTIGGPQENKAV